MIVKPIASAPKSQSDNDSAAARFNNQNKISGSGSMKTSMAISALRDGAVSPGATAATKR